MNKTPILTVDRKRPADPILSRYGLLDDVEKITVAPLDRRIADLLIDEHTGKFQVPNDEKKMEILMVLTEKYVDEALAKFNGSLTDPGFRKRFTTQATVWFSDQICHHIWERWPD